MMRNCILALLLFIVSMPAYAQSTDSLFAVRKIPNWAIRYTIQPRETLTMLARRFSLAVVDIEDANDVEQIKRLVPGMIINIPVTKENYFIKKPPLDMSDLRELYYHVGNRDDINVISTYAGISKAQMRLWNGLKGNTLVYGQALFIGWVKMLSFDSTNPVAVASYPAVKKAVEVTDTVKVPVLGGLDTIYDRQTSNGMNVLTEKGTAVFFEKPGKNTMYYAFHNATQRGSIIKIFNPGSGKTIYAKVLGPVPNTKLYANCIIGICDAAKEALGVNDNKAWCELSYLAN